MHKAEGRKGKKVEFLLAAEPGNDIFVDGTFNGWDAGANPLKGKPKAGHYKTALRLPPGRHEYKFVVNGEWRLDPNCPERTPNGHGSLNSVINI